jgi:hypothetical protein
MEQEIKRNIPRDLFLHLLAIVTLYWSAISFVTLLWQYINYYFPDALNRYVYMSGFNGTIRFAVSSLIIVFPIFILVSWFLNKIYRKEAVVRESRIRKWLIYLTLFIASLVIIGDLIAVINMLLGGEITARFILKALSILLVAGLVFGYYLDDVRRETPTKMAKYFAWATSVLVLVVIIGAFFIVGSPMTARLMEFDQQKVSDLQGIQSQVVNYWQKKEALPAQLSDLNDLISGYSVPVDPQTNTSYEYIIKDSENLSFELCATFNREGNDQYRAMPAAKVLSQGNMSVNDWEHSAGRFCYEITIDKQFYPPFSQIK